MQVERGNRPLKVLIVEDNLDDALLMVNELGSAGLAFVHKVVDDEPGFLASLDAGVDVVLCDHTLPRFSARRAFDLLQERAMHLPVLVVSGTITDDLAVEYMQRGACDYVLKDRLSRLGPAVRNALERYRFEAEAAQANQRLSRLMEEFGIAAIASEVGGRITATNDVGWRLFGCPSREAFLATPAQSFYTRPVQRADLLARLEHEGKVTANEVEFQRLDGSTFWATCQYHAVTDEHGRLTHLETLITDTSERKRAEREVAVSRQRLDSALHNAPIAVITFDRDRRFVFAGGTALERLGIDAASLIGRQIDEIARDRPDVVDVLKRAVDGEEFDREGEFAGRYFHLKISHVPSNGSPQGAFVVGFDITARHEAELNAEARARQQAAVRQLAQEALNSPPLAQLMHRAVRLLAAGLNAEMASIHELEPGGATATKLASIGYKHPQDTVRIEPGGVAEAVLMRHGVLAIEDYPKSGLRPAASVADEGVKSTLAFAIQDGRQQFGFVCAHQRALHAWTQDEREFIELIGQTILVAVERQHLEEQRGQLISRLVDAQEQERRRIAADVHDDAVQVMSAALMRLHLLSQRMEDPAQLAMATKLQSTVSLAIERLRHLLFELSPPALERGGLMSALNTFVEEFQRDFGIMTELRGGLTVDPDPASGLVIYRIIQEAFTNVHKHARATRVELTIREVDGGALVRIEDDGRGFDPHESRPESLKHIGLGSMRERAELSGGWWKIASAPTSGTHIEFWVPVETARRELSAS